MAELKRLKFWWNYYYFNTPPAHVESISLNKNSIELTSAWQTEQLIATVLPSDAVEKKVIWSSSDNSIATVSDDWLVYCVTPWQCVITASVWLLTATCQVKSWTFINFLLVWWWGWWYTSWGGWWEVLFWTASYPLWEEICVIIWTSWTGNGWCSKFGAIVAKWWFCADFNGWESWSWCTWWWYSSQENAYWGWWWAWWNWCSNNGWNWGDWGIWLCGYWGWWAWWWYTWWGSSTDWWGTSTWAYWCNATGYWWWGGWGRMAYRTSWCQWVVDVCYLIDGSCWLTCATWWDCCYTCDWYCVHRFTSNGTFCIVS